MPKRPKDESPRIAKAYEHSEKGLLRPEIGLQPQFRLGKPSKRYKYDPSLDPELSWDVNEDRERGEALIRRIFMPSTAFAARTRRFESDRVRFASGLSLHRPPESPAESGSHYIHHAPPWGEKLYPSGQSIFHR